MVNLMEYITLSISETEKDMLIKFYDDKVIDIKADYLIFAAQVEDVKILIYSSKKGYKVSFQGKNVLDEAKTFFPNATLKEKKEKVKTSFIDVSSQIGSDEVGTGDLFGPIVVTACYYDESVNESIKDFRIDDSKKLSDDKISEVVEKLLPMLTFSKFTLMPEQYNKMIELGYSMNEIKAILHNKALISLSKKVKYNNIYIDQFCDSELFHGYLIKAQEKEIDNINFYTKGESKFPSIALASMISRYSFLLSWQKMCAEYQIEFVKGAGIKVDEILKEFILKYGKDELYKVAKLNFKNIKELD